MYHSFSDPTHCKGVSILLSKRLNYQVVSSHTDRYGRIVLLNIEVDKKEYTFVSIYAPNAVQERIMFFRQLHTFIDTHAMNKNRLVIAGDFNCSLNECDRISRKVDKSTNSLKHVMAELNIIDM